jgi:regulator of protease activity HflC (stomatin/prohibitin superfamily)
MNGILVLLFVVGIFVIIFVLRGITIVRQAEVMVVERLGKYHKTLSSGVNIIVPVFDRAKKINWRYVKETSDGTRYYLVKKLSRIDLRENVYDFPRQNVITKDNVIIEINALLYFQITDPVKSVYEIANLPDAIEKLTQTTLRNVIGEMDLDETLASRDKVNSTLKLILDEATDKWGVKVNRVELQDINPPRDIKDAMEKQMRAERDRRAAILTAEGQKRARILEAEGFREATINKAQGEKQAKVLIAEGMAEARVKVAKAEAEAIVNITESISISNGDPSTYLIAIRYIDTLKEMVSGKENKVVYLPYEATGVLSSLGGIKDMFNGVKASK